MKMTGFWFFLPVLLLCIGQKFVLSESDSDFAESIFKFVNSTLNILNGMDNSNIILVIGETGTGKSTLVHYVACDYSKMKSINDGEEELEIRDELDADVDKKLPTTVSRTLIPEPYIDDEQNVWIDCPGFKDTRSTTVQIAVAYLLKSITEKTSSIKFVLVADYNSVTESRNNFDALLIQTTQLIKNVQKYKGSVSLVLTKVPPSKSWRGRVLDISDAFVKDITAKFITNHKAVLQETAPNEVEKILLIDSLLKSTSDDFPRISIFWRPNVVGAFDKIPKMIKGRQKIRESIIKETSYTKVHESDFGLSLSAEAQIEIANLIDYLTKEISKELSNVDHKLLGLLEQQLNSTVGFQNKLNLMKLGISCTRSVSNKSLERQIGKLRNFAHIFNFTSIDENKLIRALKYKDEVNSLKSLAKSDIFIPFYEWIGSSSRAFDFQCKEYDWYLFLDETYQLLRSYEVQRNVSAFILTHIKNWVDELSIDENNFDQFANRILHGRILKPTSSKIEELNEIVGITLKSSPAFECSVETMKIKGYFVKSFDIQMNGRE